MSDFGNFQQEFLEHIAAAMGLTYEQLSADFLACERRAAAEARERTAGTGDEA